MTLWRFAEKKTSWQQRVFTTTNYTNDANFQNVDSGASSRLRITRIIRISKTSATNCLYDYELRELYEWSYADTSGTNSYNS